MTTSEKFTPTYRALRELAADSARSMRRTKISDMRNYYEGKYRAYARAAHMLATNCEIWYSEVPTKETVK